MSTLMWKLPRTGTLYISIHYVSTCLIWQIIDISHVTNSPSPILIHRHVSPRQ
jgi:hypothetical protein